MVISNSTDSHSSSNQSIDSALSNRDGENNLELISIQIVYLFYDLLSVCLKRRLTRTSHLILKHLVYHCCLSWLISLLWLSRRWIVVLAVLHLYLSRISHRYFISHLILWPCKLINSIWWFVCFMWDHIELSNNFICLLYIQSQRLKFLCHKICRFIISFCFGNLFKIIYWFRDELRDIMDFCQNFCIIICIDKLDELFINNLDIWNILVEFL